MLTASTRWGTRSSDRITACRRDCSVRPWRASTSTRPRSAVEAPVTMLRVYCTWPGVSAMMNLRFGRREVAVGDVDGDALLALGAEAVGEQREVGVVVALATGWWPRRPRAGPRRSTSSRAAADRSGSTCRRRRSRRWRTAAGPSRVCSATIVVVRSGPSEVAFLLPVLHGCLGEPVVAAGRAALGDAGDGDLVDDLRRWCRRRTRRSRSASGRRRCGSARCAPRPPRRLRSGLNSLSVSSMPSRSKTRRWWEK